ncbi:MAG TPA: PhoH family protein, partial [Halomonas sp.]|nr:PhoH family protein [Halomonas sp.]
RVTHFAAKDVVRHPLVQRIIEAYDEFESQQEVAERARREARQQEREARMQAMERNSYSDRSGENDR